MPLGVQAPSPFPPGSVLSQGRATSRWSRRIDEVLSLLVVTNTTEIKIALLEALLESRQHYPPTPDQLGVEQGGELGAISGRGSRADSL